MSMDRNTESLTHFLDVLASLEKYLAIDVQKKVFIFGLEDREELNEKVGTVVAMNVSRGQHVVDL